MQVKKITLVQGSDPSGRSRYTDLPPLIRHWQLKVLPVLMSTRLLVKVLGRVLE